MTKFVGNVQEGYVLVDMFDDVDFSDSIKSVSELADTITERPYEHIIIDVTQFCEDANEVANELKRLQNLTDTAFLLFAIGYSLESNLIMALKAAGFKHFVNEESLTSQKKSIARAFKDENECEEIISPSEREKNAEAKKRALALEKEILNEGNTKTIAFAGCFERIGTTTQALQFTKFLKFKGYKAAYFEMNFSGFIKAMTRTYDGAVDSKNGKVKYKNTEMFYKQDEFFLQKNNYDYCVLDYGVLSEANKLAFLDNNVCVLCCGVSPGEFEASARAMALTAVKSNLKFIFSFTSEGDEKEINSLMSKHAKNTLYAEYTPDAFFLSSKSIKKYEKLLKLSQNEKEKSRFRLFRKDAKNG